MQGQEVNRTDREAALALAIETVARYARARSLHAVDDLLLDVLAELFHSERSETPMPELAEPA